MRVFASPLPLSPLKKVINRLEPAGTKQAALQQTIDERKKSLDQSVKIEGERKKSCKRLAFKS